MANRYVVLQGVMSPVPYGWAPLAEFGSVYDAVAYCLAYCGWRTDDDYTPMGVYDLAVGRWVQLAHTSIGESPC